MLKQAIIGLSLLASASVAQASIIVTDSVVFGSDMVGMGVTVQFADGSSDTGVWSMISDTPLNTGNAILDQNGFSGGVVTDSWSLTQAGSTLGGFAVPGDASTAYGLWTLSNLSSASDIVGFSINGWLGSSTNVAFDIISGSEEFPGSESGQAFVSDVLATSVYSNQVDASFNDLFYQLNVSLDAGLSAQQSALFFADTDLVSVSEPATLGLLFGGLVLFARKLRSSAKG